MNRWSLLACVALSIVVSGCVGHETMGASDTVRVRIGMLGFPPANRFFTLTCHPTGGTLPFAGRVCRDIDRYPVAMLHPPNPNPNCVGVLAEVSIRTTLDGGTSEAEGLPGCARIGGVRFGVYLAAAERNSRLLTYWERRLRCDCPPSPPRQR